MSTTGCQHILPDDSRCGKKIELFGFLCLEHGEPRRCKAMLKTENGNPQRQCRRVQVVGMEYCTNHGGVKVPPGQHTIRKLADLIDPALNALYDILADKKASNADRIRAAKEVLDRVEGFAPIKAAGGLGGMVAGELLRGENTAMAFILANPEAQRALDVAAREAAKAIPALKKADEKNN